MLFFNSKRKYKDVKAVCFVDSTLSLLFYAVLYGKKQFDSTFFFVGEAISEHVRERMFFCKYLPRCWSKKKRLFRVFFFFMFYRSSWLRWPFLRYLPIYGADNLWFTPGLLRNRTMIVLEDGLANYNNDALLENTRCSYKFLHQWIWGPIQCKGQYGYSSQVTQIVLRGFLPIPDCVKAKTKVVNLQDLWQRSTDKKFILNLFGLTDNDINILRKKSIVLLTQPFDINEEELVRIYQRIIELFPPEKVVIKTHPRDTLNYTDLFPDIMVFSKQVPAELFALIGSRFTDVYTICSTAIYSFPDSVEKHFLGTEYHPLLLEKYGKVTM